MAPDVVVVGASAGGVESLRGFVAGLAPGLKASVVIVLHVSATAPSMLPTILGRVSALPVKGATDHEELQHGRILVAAPDHHLVVTDGHVGLSRGPRENGHRPAIDVLFRSAAVACGERVVGVILSGALDDGTAGMGAVRRMGGSVLAQSPDEAAYPSMPASVIRAVGADLVGTVSELAAAVNELTESTESTRPPDVSSDELLSEEVRMATMDDAAFEDPERPGRPAGFSCPDCSGTLFEIDDSGLLRFRCRVGHAWSPDSLLAAQTKELEGALWMAFRSLEEKAALSRQLAARAGERGNRLTEQRYLGKADEASRSASVLKQVLEQPLGRLPVEDAVEEKDVEQV
ncbi:chemotaxis protein CheB [Knoellia sp. CPCC 206450]|uniref:chemotaxis protein CheB n=1 Tax=Knoellia tibetensis TaxID=3404798 RepID=UPI003B4360FC